MVQSTIKVILNVSTGFQVHFCGIKIVIRMNSWVEWVQKTTKVILRISTEFQLHLFKVK